MAMPRFYFLIICLSGQLAGHAALSEAEIATRVEQWLGQMTLAEKLGQMMMVQESYITDEEIRDLAPGAVLISPRPNLRPGIDTAEEWADFYDPRIQASLESRLGIPVLLGVDAVHGHALAIGATIFPHNVGLAATGDPEGVRLMGAAVADEVRATAGHWILAPTVAVVRDLRWGRTYEGWGERPELQTGFVKAFVEGVQAGGKRPVLATAKHFIGDGGATWRTGESSLLDRGDVQLSEAALRAIHLPPYREAVEAGVASIMASYGKWNGVEVHHHGYLLTTILKGELGFEGFIVSDANGFFENGQDYAERLLSSALAGLDLFMLTDAQWSQFLPAMTAHVVNGALPAARVDDAVRRILRAKVRFGLFDHPLADRDLVAEGALGNPRHREIARGLVQKSAVLLSNREQLLPLNPSGLRVGVSGAFANDIGPQCGGWTVGWSGLTAPDSSIIVGTTLRQAIEQEVIPAGGQVFYDPSGASLPDDLDVVIHVAGEKPYAEWYGDTANPEFPRNEREAIANLRLRGLPVVVVLIGGRPIIVGPQVRDWNVVIMAFLPGSEGQGLADLIFGRVPFTGRLPHTWPRQSGHLPMNFGEPWPAAPAFPLGHGMSTLGIPQVRPATLPPLHRGEPFHAQLTLEPVPNGATAWTLDEGMLPSGLHLGADGLLTGTATTAGLYPVFLQTTAGEVTTRLPLVLQVTDLPSPAQWAATFAWARSGDDLPASDPDGDGSPNEVERLLGSDPLTPHAQDLPWVSTRRSGDLYRVRLNFAAATQERVERIQVQYSRNLRDWVTSPTEVKSLSGSPGIYYTETGWLEETSWLLRLLIEE